MKAKQSLTIGLVSPYALVSGGIQNHILELKEALSRRGHCVHLFAPQLDDEQPPDKYTHLLGKAIMVYAEGTSATPGIWPEDGKKVKKLLSSIPFDILHFHSPLISPTAWQILAHAQAPIVISFHEAREKIYPWHKLVKIPAALFLKKAQKMIAVSHACANTISELFRAKFTVIPNGIYSKKFSPKGKTMPWFNNSVITLLFLGRLEHRKGVLELLEAYPKIKKQIPKVQLVICGQGLLEEQIKKIIKEKNLKNVILTGFVPESEKPIYLRSCHIFCAPATHDESFGIVLLEAMASGRPIVAFANKGYRDMLAGQKEGILVPPKDIDAFADAVANLAKDRQKQHQMGENGIAKAKQYDWQHIVPQITDVYYQAISAYQQDKRVENNNSFFKKIEKTIKEKLAEMWSSA